MWTYLRPRALADTDDPVLVWVEHLAHLQPAVAIQHMPAL